MLPVIMVTSSIGQEKTRAIEAGADDFIPKPFNHDELLTRVRSLLRIKRYHDTIKAQAASSPSSTARSKSGCRRRSRSSNACGGCGGSSRPSSRMRSSRPVTRRSSRSHRRQVAMFFADLRGWTNFVDAVEPEELMRVLREFHETSACSCKRFDATVGFLEGDGVELFFNDPIEIPDAPLRAVRLGCALREEMADLTPLWRKRGYELDFGAGIALGYATCGEVGFEGRSDYAAIGAVTNLASRLADEATGGQVLISQRLYAEVEDGVEAESAGEFTLKGFAGRYLPTTSSRSARPPNWHARNAPAAQLHTHRVVAAVDVQRRAGHVGRAVAEEVSGRRADVVGGDVAAER